MKIVGKILRPWLFVCLFSAAILPAQTDPGPRGGPPRGGFPVQGLSTAELGLFMEGKDAFQEVDRVENGLGPRFNLDSCGGCHSHPAIGGASPALNPQISVATKEGALNQVPPFLQSNGPIRVVRFR